MLSSDALLNGHGYSSREYDYYGYGTTTGNMQMPYCQIFLCWAAESEHDVLLNLLYLNYEESGNSISLAGGLDANDTRGSLFEYYQNLDENGSHITQGNFAVQVVPVPAAFWLFGSGLLSLFTIARRVASTQTKRRL